MSPDDAGAQPIEPREPWQWRRRHWLFALATLMVFAPLYIASFVEVPYYTVGLGDARSVGDLIGVGDDTQVFDSDGRILFTTVSLAGKVNIYDAIRGWLDENIDVVHEDLITGGKSREETRRQNFALMDDSKLVATRVALEHLGLRVPVQEAVLVVEVLPGSPADGNLEPGDIITSIDGHPVTVSQQAVDRVQARSPGDVIDFTVQRRNTTGEYTDVTTQVTAGDSETGTAYVGIRMQTQALNYEFPIKVEIDTGLVSGPSAGLAFTLAIIDELTEGDLTGGRSVAVTGTIDGAGNVGAVGGVGQKTVAARHVGADIFLVPAAELAQAQAKAKDLQVVGVNTLSDAIAALQELGGTGLALPQASAASS